MYTVIKLATLLALKSAVLSRALQVSRINYVSTISFDRVFSLVCYSDIIAPVLLYKTKPRLYNEITTKTTHSSCCTTIRIFMALKYKRINWKKHFKWRIGKLCPSSQWRSSKLHEMWHLLRSYEYRCG